MKRMILAALGGLALTITGAIQPASSQEVYTTLRIGDTKPELDVQLLNGGPVPTWPGLKGKIVVIDFWATWCPPCVGSFPRLNELQKRFAAAPVVFLSITYEPASYVKRFLATHALDTTIAIDNDFHTFKSFGGWGIPTVYILDRDGTVVSVNHPDQLTEAVIQAVLEGKKPQVPQYHGWEKPEEAEQYFRKLLKEIREKEGPIKER